MAARCRRSAGGGEVDALQILSVVGAVALGAMALPFLVGPRLAEKLGVTALNGNGRLELRGIYGGLLFALAAVCLAARGPYAFLTAGVALLGFAVVGFVALAVDRPRVVQGVAVSGVHTLLGLLLLAGFWGWRAAAPPLPVTEGAR
jgi:hypothetical protein